MMWDDVTSPGYLLGTYHERGSENQIRSLLLVPYAIPRKKRRSQVAEGGEKDSMRQKKSRTHHRSDNLRSVDQSQHKHMYALRVRLHDGQPNGCMRSGFCASADAQKMLAPTKPCPCSEMG